MNTTTGFKLLLQKTRETTIFGPSFTENWKEKKKWGFPLKLFYFTDVFEKILQHF